MTAEPGTVDVARFAAIMAGLGPWNTDRRVAVAVSGGADSLCLAWFAARWGRPSAFIVDHGLRAESGAEAELATKRLAGMGVGARTLRLQLRPGPGLPARARAARYAALAAAAAAYGFSDLLLGHHAADQAETVFFRSEAGSGPSGLAGMASITSMPGLRLVRPLLGIEPPHLRATLLAQEIGWSEDPSNADPAATRTRTRLALAANPGLSARLLDQSARHGLARRAREIEIASLLARRLSVFPEGHALLTGGPLEPDALAAVIRGLTGAAYPAASATLARRATWLEGATLGGLRFLQAGRLGLALQDGRLGLATLVVREAAAMQASVPAENGAVWDARFVLHGAASLPPRATIGALGDDAARFRRSSPLPSIVLQTLPALRLDGDILAVPHLGVVIGWTNRDAKLTFLPSVPVAGAPFEPCLAGDVQHGRKPHVADKPAAFAPSSSA